MERENNTWCRIWNSEGKMFKESLFYFGEYVRNMDLFDLYAFLQEF